MDQQCGETQILGDNNGWIETEIQSSTAKGEYLLKSRTMTGF